MQWLIPKNTNPIENLANFLDIFFKERISL